MRPSGAYRASMRSPLVRHINFQHADRCLQAPRLRNSSQAHEMHRWNQGATRSDPHQRRFLAQSRWRPDQDRLPAASRFAWTRHLPMLLARPRLPSVCSISCLTSTGVGRPSGPVMNSEALRCARRRASGKHSQTKLLTLQPVSNPTRPRLRLGRAAGARERLIRARDRSTRWPGVGQHSRELRTRIALALAISIGSKSMALAPRPSPGLPDPLSPS